MARGQLAFKQRDAARALRATKAAGLTVERMEIDRSGKIIIIVDNASCCVDTGRDNEWDAPSAEPRR